ncbi:hypothetical protein ISN45_Aa08g018680 [Arabidopsis thaliana x Arabidopsis arenosa]|uniref:Uncharacterized protein n=1 Tax=Arabidopsis thaliana x Arabidopsis arenosa TaxID=1240361 RepID=A0A8T1XIG7_9BRAS|nr:hypothetical protein ISN45_Aa08g018680 [Arabidopsis thaliana x Arabidopsis arenosa]
MVSSHRLLTLMVFVLLLIPMISGGQITDKCTEGCRSEMACNLHCLKRGLGHCEKAILHGAPVIFCCCNEYSNSPISSPVMND